MLCSVLKFFKTDRGRDLPKAIKQADGKGGSLAETRSFRIFT